MSWFDLPAALLMGSMAAAIAVAATEGSVRVPRAGFVAAQAVIGCMVSRSLTPSILGDMFHDWPLFLGTIFAIIVASGWLGWLLARWQIVPGATAVWGLSPGASSVMTVMSEAYGADSRLVAFMQYTRLLLVTLAAAIVGRLWASPHTIGPSPAWFPPVQWGALGETLALVWISAFGAVRLRVPGGPILFPMFLSALLRGLGLFTVELPPALLALSYALVGWSIGLRFNRSILAHAVRVLPGIVGSILALMVVCGVFAALLTGVMGTDPLTAYLATSPGGADSIAIIAASTKVDLPFVMAMQTGRFLLILLAGRAIARFVVRRMPAPEASSLQSDL